MFNERQQEIIKLVIKNPQGIHGSTISDTLNVSTRTIRNDITAINKELKDRKYRIDSSNKSGYFIHPDYKDSLNNLIHHPLERLTNYSLQDNRILGILGQILFAGKQNYFDLAELLFVSEQTVYKEITKLNQILDSKYNFPAIKTESTNISLDAAEEEYRFLLFKILKELVLSNQPDHLKNLQILLNGNIDIQEFQLLNIKVRNYLAFQRLSTDDKSIELIVGAIYIVTIRNRCGFEVTKKSLEFVNEHVDLLLRELIKSGIEINESDQNCLNRFLWSIKFSTNDEKMNISVTALTVLNELCREVLDKYSIDLRESEETMGYLKVHIEYMIRRIDTDFELHNPMIADIKKKYPFSYEIAMLIVHNVYKYKNKYLSDDEISYIAIYIETFLQKNNNKVKTVIINNANMGINRILENWLHNNFQNQIEVVQYLPFYSLEEYLKDQKVELIITTNNFHTELNIPCYVIERIPEKNDYLSLSTIIHKIKRSNRYEKLIKRMFSDEFITIYDEPTNFEEITTEMAVKLQEHKRIEDSGKFIQDVLEREKNYPTLINKKFMIPHPLMTFAKKTTVSVAICKEPLLHNGEKIKLIFWLAIENKMDDDVTVLFHFIKQLALNKDALSSLIEVKKKHEFLDKLIYLSRSLNSETDLV